MLQSYLRCVRVDIDIHIHIYIYIYVQQQQQQQQQQHQQQQQQQQQQQHQQQQQQHTLCKIWLLLMHVKSSPWLLLIHVRSSPWLLLMMLGATIIRRPRATWHTPPMYTPTTWLTLYNSKTQLTGGNQGEHVAHHMQQPYIFQNNKRLPNNPRQISWTGLAWLGWAWLGWAWLGWAWLGWAWVGFAYCYVCMLLCFSWIPPVNMLLCADVVCCCCVLLMCSWNCDPMMKRALH